MMTTLSTATGTHPDAEGWHGPGVRELYETQRWSLCRLAARLLHDPAEAEEVVHVAIGYTNPNGGTSTAAVVHLRRFGSGSDAP